MLNPSVTASADKDVVPKLVRQCILLRLSCLSPSRIPQSFVLSEQTGCQPTKGPGCLMFIVVRKQLCWLINLVTVELSCHSDSCQNLSSGQVFPSRERHRWGVGGNNPRWEVWTFRWYTWTISSSAPVLALHGSPEDSQAWGPGIFEAD